MNLPDEALTYLMVTARKAAQWLVPILADQGKAAALDELGVSRDARAHQRRLYRVMARRLWRK